MCQFRVDNSSHPVGKIVPYLGALGVRYSGTVPMYFF